MFCTSPVAEVSPKKVTRPGELTMISNLGATNNIVLKLTISQAENNCLRPPPQLACPAPPGSPPFKLQTEFPLTPSQKPPHGGLKLEGECSPKLSGSDPHNFLLPLKGSTTQLAGFPFWNLVNLEKSRKWLPSSFHTRCLCRHRHRHQASNLAWAHSKLLVHLENTKQSPSSTSEILLRVS